jgi:CheY-like chemotaxis protein
VPKILVADDNTNIQKMVVLAFEERGIAVTSVGNGEAAVRRIPDVNPDLVLADVFMPVRNGYEVCEFVKKDERFSHVPVILLVGAFDPLDEREARRVGADGVLKKPFVPPDPLIAMVMSALEKNPKVAAELAKAREVAAAPPEPPMPALEIPAKTEPKPLPEYPEPTPEEAAQIYGFGKGVRTIDEAEEGQAKGPVDAGKEEETEEEFDGSSTTSDWRRSAADFEVPSDANGKLAFADDGDFNPVTFPSERDVPPRRIRVEEQEEEIQPVVVQETPVSAYSEEPVAEAAASEASESEPEIQAPAAAAVEEKIETPVAAASPETSAPEHPPAQAEEKPHPGIVSKAMHWMDMMAPTPSENSNGGGWMANLLGFRKEHEKEPQQTQASESAPAAAESSPHPADTAQVEAHAESTTEVLPETAPEPAAAEPIEPAVAHTESEPEGEGSQPSWGETSSPRSSWSLPSLQTSEPAHAEAIQPVSSFSQPEQSAGDEVEHDEDTSEPSLRDPLLVESPAVHVEPEPLLINEEPVARGEYGVPQEQLTPLHSFFSPAGEAVVEEPAATEPAPRNEFPAFEPPRAEASADEFDGRIPTVPPPNREAISSIPFLNPPACVPEESHSEAPTSQLASSDSGTVDAVVKRVLEKLEPQLHQILSQNVLKPLVENMLQQDLEKKGK